MGQTNSQHSSTWEKERSSNHPNCRHMKMWRFDVHTEWQSWWCNTGTCSSQRIPIHSNSLTAAQKGIHQISKWDMLHQPTYVSGINYKSGERRNAFPATTRRNQPWKWKKRKQELVMRIVIMEKSDLMGDEISITVFYQCWRVFLSFY